MQVVSYIKNINEIDRFIECGVTELIVAPKELSRFGDLTYESIISIAEKLRAKNIRPILEWDLLMTQSDFDKKSELVRPLLAHFDVVRVYDVGACGYLLSNSKASIQLVLEIGNHNQRGIEGWIKLCGDRLDRLVLSLELDSEMLKRYTSIVDVPVEFYGLGRMPLSYTPRKLVTPVFGHLGESFEIIASSEESPHKGFPVLQNTHGTFTFYMLDHGPIDHFGEMSEMGIDFLRIDLRHLPDLTLLKDACALVANFSSELCDSFKERYPRRLFKGFYNKNKSDSVFKKLKNERLSRTEEGYLGEVIDVAKKRYMGLIVRSNLIVTIGVVLRFRTPEGKEKKITITHLFDSSYNPIDSAVQGQLFYLPHLGGISTRTAVFVCDSTH
ncbi:MAG: U32 family peptidase [Bacteriovoracaceae bacterium]|nr:U32 family peptidase [Bacteriovoracaceae bacterium]